MDYKSWALENTIYRVCAGSRLYGTSRPSSDWDIRGVCAMPPESLFGLGSFDQYNATDEDDDIVIYGLTKFFRLAMQCNPNILDILFAPPEKWIVKTDEWTDIYESRHMFLSQRVRHTYSGYAHSQLKRLQGHYVWLTNPPSYMPTLEEFGGWLANDKKGGQRKVFPDIDSENRYTAATKKWKQYQTWLAERNPERAKLERKFGYDTKHASHLVRLMLQCEDILTHGTYSPTLTGMSLSTVLAVLRGEWEYDRLVSFAETYDSLLAVIQTGLPKKADYHGIEQLLMRLNIKMAHLVLPGSVNVGD